MTSLLSSPAATPSYVLTVICNDRPGLVAAVATTLVQQGGKIVDAAQFNDQENGNFFMRVVFETHGNRQQLHLAPESLSSTYQMMWTSRPYVQRHRVLMMVSQFDHCLGDLLYRARIGELNMNPVSLSAGHQGYASTHDGAH